MKIEKISESIDGKKAVKLPNKDGWYWVVLTGQYYGGDPILLPCWFTVSNSCFLPGGLGDSSSNGIYEDDIDRVGPEIVPPKF